MTTFKNDAPSYTFTDADLFHNFTGPVISQSEQLKLLTGGFAGQVTLGFKYQSQSLSPTSFSPFSSELPSEWSPASSLFPDSPLSETPLFDSCRLHPPVDPRDGAMVFRTSTIGPSTTDPILVRKMKELSFDDHMWSSQYDPPSWTPDVRLPFNDPYGLDASSGVEDIDMPTTIDPAFISLSSERLPALPQPLRTTKSLFTPPPSPRSVMDVDLSMTSPPATASSHTPLLADDANVRISKEGDPFTHVSTSLSARIEQGFSLTPPVLTASHSRSLQFISPKLNRPSLSAAASLPTPSSTPTKVNKRSPRKSKTPTKGTKEQLVPLPDDLAAVAVAKKTKATKDARVGRLWCPNGCARSLSRLDALHRHLRTSCPHTRRERDAAEAPSGGSDNHSLGLSM